MEVPLLPNETPETYKDLYSKKEQVSGFESFLAARFAAWLVYRMAGIKDPLEEMDLVELHDAFTISDLQTYGDIGPGPMARSKITLSLEMPITSIQIQGTWEMSFQLSGGLIGTMHAVGATGIFQSAECYGSCSRSTINFMGILRSGRNGVKKNQRIGKACRSLKK